MDNLLESDATKVAIRVMAPTSAGPALSAPPVHAQVAAPKVSAQDDEAAAYDEPVIKQAPPAVAPVKQSAELEMKLDSLFD